MAKVVALLVILVVVVVVVVAMAVAVVVVVAVVVAVVTGVRLCARAKIAERLLANSLTIHSGRRRRRRPVAAGPQKQFLTAGKNP